MADTFKAFPSRDVLDGVSTIQPSPGHQSGDYSFIAAHTIPEALVYSDITGFTSQVNLASRFLIDPTGWNS